MAVDDDLRNDEAQEEYLNAIDRANAEQQRQLAAKRRAYQLRAERAREREQDNDVFDDLF